MNNPAQRKILIEFYLSRLAIQNKHHLFEEISLEVARARMKPNLALSTGPVGGNGDRGRDGESYWSELTTKGGLTRWIPGSGGDPATVLACTTQQKGIKKKIADDLEKMTKSGTAVSVALYFTTADVQAANAADLKQDALTIHGITLEIMDLGRISRELADEDLYWAAMQYLAAPTDGWNASARSFRHGASRVPPRTRYPDTLFALLDLDSATKPDDDELAFMVEELPRAVDWINRIAELGDDYREVLAAIITLGDIGTNGSVTLNGIEQLIQQVSIYPERVRGLLLDLEKRELLNLDLDVESSGEITLREPHFHADVDYFARLKELVDSDPRTMKKVMTDLDFTLFS